MPRKSLTLVALLVAAALAAGACRTVASSGPLADGVRASRDGLWDEAAERWQKALALDPDSAPALNNLGVAAERAGHEDEARRYYREAAGIDPDNVYIQENLARFDRPGDIDAEPGTTPDSTAGSGVRVVSFTRRTAASFDLASYSEILVASFRQDQEPPDPGLTDWLGDQLASMFGRSFKGPVGRAEVDWSGSARLDNPPFWKTLGGSREGVAILSGSLKFTARTEKALPAGGIVRDGPFGNRERGLKERHRFLLTLEPVLLSAATGEPLFTETYTETRVYDDPSPSDLVAFAALLDGALPRFLAAVLGADTVQTRFLLLR